MGRVRELAPDVDEKGPATVAAKPAKPATRSVDFQDRTADRVLAQLRGLSQPKLLVGASDTPAELEADSVARTVVAALQGASLSGPIAASGPVAARAPRPVAPELNRWSPTPAEGGTVDRATEAAIGAAHRTTSPLASSVRRRMEGAFGGADFGHVRVSAGPMAANLNQRFGAKAFTLGSDIFFKDRLPDTDTRDGQTLLAHELTHTIQQKGGVARSVQRAGEVDVEEGVGKSGDIADFVSGQVNQYSGAPQFTDKSLYGAGNNTQGGMVGTEVGSVMGVLSGGLGTVKNSIDSAKSGITKREEEKAGRGGQAKHRDAARGEKTGAGNAISSAGNLANAGQSTAGTALNLAGATSNAANVLGATAGAIMLPFQIFSTCRTLRKAAKQWDRATRLGKQIFNPEADEKAATKALAQQKEMLGAFKATKASVEEELNKARVLARAARASGKQPNLQEIGELEAAVLRLDGHITTCEQEIVDQEKIKQASVDAIKAAALRAENGTENPDDIRIYALAKNNSGKKKKIINSVAGFIGIGGGIAGTVAAIAIAAAGGAAAVALAATPVGWALAGAAAVIALAMTGLAVWKACSKKYARAVKAGESKGKAFLTAINPFKKIGKSRREVNAQRLFEYANGTLVPTPTADDIRKAKLTIEALGLDFDNMHMGAHPKESIKLIYEKMAS